MPDADMIIGDYAPAPNIPLYKKALHGVGNFCSKVFNSHAINSSIRSWAVAITACFANILSRCREIEIQ